MLKWRVGEPNADIADKGGRGVIEMLTLLTRGVQKRLKLG